VGAQHFYAQRRRPHSFAVEKSGPAFCREATEDNTTMLASRLILLGVLTRSQCYPALTHEEPDGQDLHDHHKIIDIVGHKEWEKLHEDSHVWVVKFYSELCGSCQQFAPAFDGARDHVDGLHWAAICVDTKSNLKIAQKMGVLEEGIPNVKLVNVAEQPLTVVSGDTPTEESFIAALRETLKNAGAQLDSSGYYRSHSRAEL
jgi:thioredoxin-like negative regulator of GroEL